jgi:alkylhydroperoxidase/carboxymuconolactone decarboxylase family protein YurZ
MNKSLPSSIQEFERQYPEVWQAFAVLGEKCHEKGGPLDVRSRRLIKLGIAVASQHEGAVHSAARHAIQSGIPPEELLHVAILAITTIGWPGAYAAMTWIQDVLKQE